jgi:hypothetical protein
MPLRRRKPVGDWGVFSLFPRPMTAVLRFTSFLYIQVVVVNKAGTFLWITCFFAMFTRS